MLLELGHLQLDFFQLLLLVLVEMVLSEIQELLVMVELQEIQEIQELTVLQETLVLVILEIKDKEILARPEAEEAVVLEEEVVEEVVDCPELHLAAVVLVVLLATYHLLMELKEHQHTQVLEDREEKILEIQGALVLVGQEVEEQEIREHREM